MTDAELNAAVALLLGWPEDDLRTWRNRGEPGARWWGGYADRPIPWIVDKHGHRQFLPATDIRDAWLVVEWLREQGCLVDLASRRDGAWSFSIEDTDSGRTYDNLHRCDTPPPAICEAALAWAEERKETAP